MVNRHWMDMYEAKHLLRAAVPDGQPRISPPGTMPIKS